MSRVVQWCLELVLLVEPPWYAVYVKRLEELDKGKAPMQSLIFLVIETMAVTVTLKFNVS